MENAREFLNPNSMLTPGVAGLIAMGLANTLCQQFDLGGNWPALLALVISFLIGIVVFYANVPSIPKRLAYYVVNSLFIFSAAAGSNTVGMGVLQSPERVAAIPIAEYVAGMSVLGIKQVHAQNQGDKGWCCLNQRVADASSEECQKWGGVFSRNESEAQSACKPLEATTKGSKQQFFRSWFRK